MSEATAKKLDDDLDSEQVDPTSEDAPAQEAPTEVPQKVKPVGVARFGLVEEHRNTYRINANVETKREQVLEPGFWEHISRHLNRTDLVEVMREDCAWCLTVRVLDAGHNWANVKEYLFEDFGGALEPKEDLPSPYKVDWAGTAHKWRVLFHGERLKDGFASKELAQRYAANHAQAVKR